ncbi:condensation domain-containing protein [Nocardia alni]|uniref:condensation domain-containing protein n=1 Tax=Nocardia alni TaxID=2815723 RepID=UPI001C21302E|nr:condensation domain-containing protein [Nocardia alni]
MEYTVLSHFDIRPGSLTLWSAALLPGTGWQADDRPLTCGHTKYLRELDAADPAPGRGRWIGTVFEMDAPFDRRLIRDLTWMWHARHEGLRTTVAPMVNRETEPPRSTCAALDITIVAEWIPEVTASAEINDYLNTILEQRLSALTWPHCLIATIEHENTGDFTVLVAADHSVMDAYGQVLLVPELRALYRALLNGTACRRSDTFASAADYAALERQAADALTPESPAVDLWREFLAESGGRFPRFEPVPGDLGDAAEPVTGPQTSVSRWLLDDSDIRVVETAAAAAGYRLTPAIFAALALAARATSGSPIFRAIMPVATRPDLRWSESMGWFVNIVPLTISVGPVGEAGGEFPAALAAADTSLRRTRALAAAPATRVFDLLGVEDAPRFVVSFVDITRLPDNELITGLRGRALRADAYGSGEIYFWIVRAAAGLNISARFCTSYPPEAVQRFVDEFTAVLRGAGADALPMEPYAPLAAVHNEVA